MKLKDRLDVETHKSKLRAKKMRLKKVLDLLDQGNTQKQIGELLGLSPARVGQMKEEALKLKALGRL